MEEYISTGKIVDDKNKAILSVLKKHLIYKHKEQYYIFEEDYDIVGFFESTNGVSAFDFRFPDTNASGNEETVKVYVTQFSQNWDYDNFYTLSATFRRVYEA